MKKPFNILQIILFITILVGCGKTKTFEKIEKIAFDSEKTALGLSEDDFLEYTILPFEFQDAELSWESSDESKVIVDSKGNIKAVGVGEAIITAKSSNEITADIKVIVYYKPGDKFKHENEPNSSIDTAELIKENGTTILGELAMYDFDIYKVYLPAGMRITGIISPEYSLDVPYYIVNLVGVNEAEEGFLATAIPSDDTRIFSYNVNVSDYYYILVYYSDKSPYITGGSYMLYIWWD